MYPEGTGFLTNNYVECRQIVSIDVIYCRLCPLEMTDPSSRQRERPTSTIPQLPDSTKNLIFGPDGCLTPRQSGRLTVRRNVTLTLIIKSSDHTQHNPDYNYFFYLQRNALPTPLPSSLPSALPSLNRVSFRRTSGHRLGAFEA
jgi:hypothetical protein